MTHDENWRTPSAYLYAAQLDLVDWAWEFLRRNPAYRADAFRRLSPGEAEDDEEPDRVIEPSADWGLRFRPIP